jgi:hypothetical protein
MIAPGKKERFHREFFAAISSLLNPLYLTPLAILAISLRVSGSVGKGFKWHQYYPRRRTPDPSSSPLRYHDKPERKGKYRSYRSAHGKTGIHFKS